MFLNAVVLSLLLNVVAMPPNAWYKRRARNESFFQCHNRSCNSHSIGPQARRVALALRGGAFRSGVNHVGNEDASCTAGTYETQRWISSTHVEYLIKPLLKRNISVDVFILTYVCFNGKQFVKELKHWYQPWTKRFRAINKTSRALEKEVFTNDTNYYFNRGSSLQGYFMIELISDMQAEAARVKKPYDFVLMLRLDIAITVPIAPLVFTSAADTMVGREFWSFSGWCTIGCLKSIYESGCVEKGPHAGVEELCKQEMGQTFHVNKKSREYLDKSLRGIVVAAVLPNGTILWNDRHLHDTLTKGGKMMGMFEDGNDTMIPTISFANRKIYLLPRFWYLWDVRNLHEPVAPRNLYQHQLTRTPLIARQHQPLLDISSRRRKS